MSESAKGRTNNGSAGPPALRREASGGAAQASLVEVIGWFLDHDPRVAMIKHPAVDELFQWKQRQSPGEETFVFDSAEDRLAIGIVQALETHRDEAALHGWIADLLGALDESSKLNEEISAAYKLRTEEGASALAEAAKIPNAREREFYLTACWLEALCTAEARVLGWIYQELYGRTFHPGNFSG